MEIRQRPIVIRILRGATISIFEINNIILTISDYWGTRPGINEIPVINTTLRALKAAIEWISILGGLAHYCPNLRL